MLRRFVKGMDMSTLAELERLGARYFDDGVEKDVLTIMKEHDVDTIRLRLWNDPFDENGEGYGAGGNDLDTDIYIGKKVTAAGMGVLLDLHYSDFWTDPGKQYKPKAWRNMSVAELEKAVYDFTYSSLKKLLSENIRVTMVQVGNEVTGGLLWPEGRLPDYDNCARFISAGIRACRDVNELIPVMIHLDNGGNNALYRRWFDNYLSRGEAFDVIGMSYYPFWHGGLSDLEDNMNDIAVRYHKDIYIAETSMGFTMEDYAEYEGLAPGDRKGYATREEVAARAEHPMTKEGQALFIADLLNRIKNVAEGRGRGFFWWEPAWIPVPGSGWATKASLKYMDNDPGPCGNEWANQALFDYDGNVNPALKVIRDFETGRGV